MIDALRFRVFGAANGVHSRTTPAPSRSKNRSILKSLLITALSIDALLGLILVYFVFLHVPYFNLQQIDVTGNRRLSRAEIIEVSKIGIGANLLTIDLNEIAADLKRHPWIRSATVHRRFPGQLVMEIEERTPRAILATEKLYYVDDQAEFYTRLLPGDSVNYPLFTGITDEALKSDASEVRHLLGLGLGLLEILERIGPGEDAFAVSEIRLNIEDGLSLKTDSGRLIVLGKGGLETKIQRYLRLKRFLTRRGEWQNIQVINLDFEDRALVRSDKQRFQG